MKALAALFVLVCFSAAAQVTSTGTILDDDDAGTFLFSGIIDEDRAYDWEEPPRGAFDGVIPARSTICSTLNPGASSSTINSAISACPEGQTVFLNAGTYNLTAGVSFGSKSNVTLRGDGASQTILDISNGASCVLRDAGICSNTAGVDEGSPPNTTTWTAGYSVGTTEITVGSSANMVVGRIIILDQLDDTLAGDTGGILVCSTMGECSDEGGGSPERTNRGQAHIARIVAINGTQVTIHPPLTEPNWRSGQSPGVWWNAAAPIVEGVGIEDLTVDVTDATGDAGILFLHNKDSWVKGVRTVNADRAHIWLHKSMQMTVRDSYMYGGQGGGSEGYGIEGYLTGWNLVVNNIANHVTSPIKHNGADTGSIYAYNFSIDDNYTASTDWMIHTIGFHEVGISYLLHEGNDGLGILHDVIHGTVNLNTAFRNHLYGDVWNSPAKSNNTAVIHVGAFGRFFNIIGNVLGRTGYYDTYETLLTDGGSAPESIYALGWEFDPGETEDPRVEGSMFRWGNYDTVTDTVRWESSEVPTADSFFPNAVPSSQTLPPSFFLTEAPSFFTTPWGTVPFPPIGPDVTGGDITGWDGHANKIPARLCYENMPKVSEIVTFDAGTCYDSNDIAVDIYQDFNFATLSVANLAANDHGNLGTWDVIDPDGQLSTSAAAEMFSRGTFSGNIDVGGTHGFRLTPPAPSSDNTHISLAFTTDQATCSYGFLYRFPAAFLTAEDEEHDIFYVENGSGTRELYIKQTMHTGRGGDLFLYSGEQGYSTAIDISGFPDTPLWLTALHDTGGAGAPHRLQAYRKIGGVWTQIGAEKTRQSHATEESHTAQLGTAIGALQGHAGSVDFDDFIIDCTDATFPLGPPM